MKKKTIWILRLLMLLGIFIGVLLWRIHNTETITPQYVFSYAENQAVNYPTTLGAEYFSKQVEERTNGRIRILVLPEAEMGDEKEVLKQLQYGGIDFARISLSQISELVPEMNVLQMPYLYENSKHMWNVLDGEIGNYFLTLPKSANLIGLSWYDAGVRSFYTSENPIICLEDLQGLRIRVQESELMSDIATALGAIPVQMAYSEVYSGLELGLVDGAENNWPSYESTQHYEVAKYFTVDEHARIPEIQLVSSHTWEILSEEDQQTIQECAKASALYERRIWKQRETKARNTALKNGAIETLLSEEEKQRFEDKVWDVYEKYCSDSMDIITTIKESTE